MKEQSFTEEVYGLYIDTPDNIFYVGRSKNSKNRFKQHCRAAAKLLGKEYNTPKYKHWREREAEGCEIGFTVLEVVDLRQNGAAEDLWIVNLRGSGTTLYNAVSGSDDRLIFVNDGIKAVWDASLFDKGWTKGGGNSKSNEWHKLINGIDFYRVGRSKLRFESGWGRFDCVGFLWDRCVDRALLYFTVGSDEYLEMRSVKKDNPIKLF